MQNYFFCGLVLMPLTLKAVRVKWQIIILFLMPFFILYLIKLLNKRRVGTCCPRVLFQVYYWVNIWNLKKTVQRLLRKSAVHGIFGRGLSDFNKWKVLCG
ncbi:Uncharacterised protein [Neisseria gonorrhoeae]|uniref:Uncharacterized protein n=1 Tax=Neisseria gonorrhoeae TaxID=485 RepID=A0A378W258_NEIGO|nr:Uncharacterised protein [Neisseria gonorrhoeae]